MGLLRCELTCCIRFIARVGVPDWRNVEEGDRSYAVGDVEVGDPEVV